MIAGRDLRLRRAGDARGPLQHGSCFEVNVPKPPGKTADPLIPPRPNLKKLKEAAAHCTACDLYKRATQTVFGEGKQTSKILFVGEQPGNSEDLEGRPFVGPAGMLLDQALEAAGIDRTQVYVTNVVKHFKWEARGKRRIHKKPNSVEINACIPWLRAEIAVIKPSAIVCLGSTAAMALISPKFRVSVQRGVFVDSDLAPLVTATVHPSSILRAPTDEDRKRETSRFIADLKKVKNAMKKVSG